MSKIRFSIATLLFILVIGGFFRFYQITEIPLGLYPDEAMNGSNAQEALKTGEFKAFYPENNGREGLFINVQALSVKIFGSEPWALRIVSAIFGTLTILGVYLVTRELFFEHPRAVALLSTFFVATSYWHINFSRIGFRAIAVPLLAAFGMYFLLRAMRSGSHLWAAAAGVAIGLGLQTYIAFRFMPFVFLAPIGWYLWGWFKKTGTMPGCAPCITLMFALATFVAFLPLGLYFIENPGDILGRSGQVSVFAADSPTFEFIKSNAATLGMFFYKGDCNWRHNYACQPELHPIVAAFFLIGIMRLLFDFRKPTSYSLPATTLLAWFVFMTFPATLTREGLPHALRSIGLIPPVMILAGYGAWQTLSFFTAWLEKSRREVGIPTSLSDDNSASGQKKKKTLEQLVRLGRETNLLFLLVLLLVPLAAYKTYFLRWAHNSNTYFEFTTDILHAGEFVAGLPNDVKKYVVVNRSGVDVRGIPVVAQPVMFVTDSFRNEEQKAKNIRYVLPGEISSIAIGEEKVVIVVLDGLDRNLMNQIRTKFPRLNVKAPSDFIIFSN